MECRHGNFWIGLGIGSILGAVAYRLSRTAKAKQLESEIYNAIHRIGRDAEIAAAHAERKETLKPCLIQNFRILYAACHNNDRYPLSFRLF